MYKWILSFGDIYYKDKFPVRCSLMNKCLSLRDDYYKNKVFYNMLIIKVKI